MITRTEGFFQAAKLLLANANRIANIRERNQKLFNAKQNPTPYQKRTAKALDAALAKTQRQLESDALDLNTYGMTPQQASHWIREQKIAAKKPEQKNQP